MPSVSTPASENMIGIAYMVVAMLAGIITSMVIKTLSVEATILVVLSLRFLFSIPPLALAAWLVRGRAMLTISRWDRLLMRIITGHIGIIFWFLSIAHTSLGQATALFQSSAIFVTILSPLVLKEKVGIYRGSAVFIGLFGIYLITNPFSDGFNIGSIHGIFSAFMGALLVVTLRLLGRTEEPVSVAIWHNLIGAIAYPAAMIVMLESGLFASVLDRNLMIILLLGVAASFVQIGFTSAYRHGEAAVLVPIRYISVPVASLIGWAVWSEQLAMMEIAGMAIVVFSCVFISVREYRLGRQMAQKASIS